MCLAPDGTETGFDTLPAPPTTSSTSSFPTTSTASRCTRSRREEDINIGNGDQFVPAVPPPACVGALHTVDVADMDAQGNYRFDADGNPNPAFDPAGDNYPAVTAAG